METKKQEELITSYLAQFEEEDKQSLYRSILLYLSELGYHPKKEKSSISFKHSLHNKQIAKMGIRISKKNGAIPVFSLRFSACREYSQRFREIVKAYILKYPVRAARCTNGACNYCAGEADTHVYTHTLPDGTRGSHCGAYAIEIPDLTKDDMAEIKKLIKEEHEYLLKQEAGIS